MLRKIVKMLLFYLGIKLLVGLIFIIIYYICQRNLSNETGEIIIKFLYLITLGIIFYFNYFPISQSTKKLGLVDFTYALVFSIGFILLKFFYIVLVEGSNIEYYTQNLTINDFVTFIILAPIVEEVLYRYYLTGYSLPKESQLSKYNVFFVVLLVSLLFASAHPEFEAKVHISHVVFSILITYLYLKTRCLFLVIAVHAVHNLLYHLNFHIFLSKELGMDASIIFLFPTLLLTLFAYKKISTNR